MKQLYNKDYNTSHHISTESLFKIEYSFVSHNCNVTAEFPENKQNHPTKEPCLNQQDSI